MSTHDKVRTFIVVALCGFIPFAWGVVIDGESADRSEDWWVIFLSGLLVIAVGSIVVESLYRKRQARSTEGESTSRDSTPR
jgi:membrane-anchored protein YejM (alkaline phosphatase superfamily)